jgi:hypothetical protein
LSAPARLYTPTSDFAIPDAPSIQTSSLELISYASVAATPREPYARCARVHVRQPVARRIGTVAASSTINTTSSAPSAKLQITGSCDGDNRSMRAIAMPIAINT